MAETHEKATLSVFPPNTTYGNLSLSTSYYMAETLDVCFSTEYHLWKSIVIQVLLYGWDKWKVPPIVVPPNITYTNLSLSTSYYMVETHERQHYLFFHWISPMEIYRYPRPIIWLRHMKSNTICCSTEYHLYKSLVIHVLLYGWDTWKTPLSVVPPNTTYGNLSLSTSYYMAETHEKATLSVFPPNTTYGNLSLSTSYYMAETFEKQHYLLFHRIPPMEIYRYPRPIIWLRHLKSNTISLSTSYYMAETLEKQHYLLFHRIPPMEIYRYSTSYYMAETHEKATLSIFPLNITYGNLSLSTSYYMAETHEKQHYLLFHRISPIQISRYPRPIIWLRHLKNTTICCSTEYHLWKSIVIHVLLYGWDTWKSNTIGFSTEYHLWKSIVIHVLLYGWDIWKATLSVVPPNTTYGNLSLSTSYYMAETLEKQHYIVIHVLLYGWDTWKATLSVVPPNTTYGNLSLFTSYYMAETHEKATLSIFPLNHLWKSIVIHVLLYGWDTWKSNTICFSTEYHRWKSIIIPVLLYGWDT